MFVCLSQAMVEQECVGAIVCKLDMHKKMFRRGYIAMLAVDSKHRRKSIGEISSTARSRTDKPQKAPPTVRQLVGATVRGKRLKKREILIEKSKYYVK